MTRLPFLGISVSIALLTAGCLPALPSIGFDQQAEAEDLLGTWKIKKTSGMKILGQGLLEYTFTDDCGWFSDTAEEEDLDYQSCEAETLTGIEFEYDFDEDDGMITILDSLEQNAGLVDGSYYVLMKNDNKMAWENELNGLKSYVFTRK